jgi:hypothetical protein
MVNLSSRMESPTFIVVIPLVLADWMSQVFHEYLGSSVVMFIDNMLVYLTDHVKCKRQSRTMLEVLREKKFFTKLKKCPSWFKLRTRTDSRFIQLK